MQCNGITLGLKYKLGGQEVGKETNGRTVGQKDKRWGGQKDRESNGYTGICQAWRATQP